MSQVDEDGVNSSITNTEDAPVDVKIDDDGGYVEFVIGDNTNHQKNGTLNEPIIRGGQREEEPDIITQLYNKEIQNPTSAPNRQETHFENPNTSRNLNEEKTDGLDNSDSDDEDDDGWCDMEATNGEQIYDDKGNILVANGSQLDSHLPISDSVFGYTRIAAQEQAENYQKADKKTDFLFNLNENHSNSKVNNLYEKNDESDEDDFNDEETNQLFEERTTPQDQLQVTKNMLTDSQKFAYIGLVKLVMFEMATEIALWATLTHNYSSRSKFIKRMNLAQSNFGQWQIKIINRLYGHLGLCAEEIEMIESLTRHGIQPDDLSKSLKVSETVDNPAYNGNVNTTNGKEIEDGNDNVIQLHDTTSVPKLEIDVAWTVICDLFLVLLADSVYDSRSRTLFIRFSQYLSQEPNDVYQFERRITDSLELEDASDQVWNEKDFMKARAKKAKRKKYMYVGLATIGGSLILGLSAGLLAPVIGAGIAAGLTSIGVAGTSGFLAGAGGTALVTIGSTAIGAKVGAQGMLKRVGDVKTFEFVPLHNNRRTNLILSVSGWMNGKADDVRLPFSTVDPVMGDLYSLLWEPEMLRSMGQTIGILASEALTQSIQQILGATILTALMSAVQVPMALSKLSYLVDNPWNVSLDRAWKAGLILADTLMSRNLGVRPVTLLGFSIGSRVIYSCLLELAKRGAYGLVEKVVIFGSPLVVSSEKLILARSVVSGDFINGYSKKDWILGYLFRATSGGFKKVAGLAPIEGVPGIQNFDCTDLVEGHMGYRKAIPQLLAKLDFQVLSEEFVEIDEPDPKEVEHQRKLIAEFDDARKQMELEQANHKKKGIWGKLFGSKRKQWWEKMYSESPNSSKESLAISTEINDVFDLEKLRDQLEDIPRSSETSDREANVKDPPLKTINLAEEDDDDEVTVGANHDKDDLKIADKDELEFPQQENITMTFDDNFDSTLKENELGGDDNETVSFGENGVRRANEHFEDEFPTTENIKMSFS